MTVPMPPPAAGPQPESGPQAGAFRARKPLHCAFRLTCFLYVMVALTTPSEAAGPNGPSETIVPVAARMDDRQARLLLARLMSRDSLLLSQAEAEYRRYLRIAPGEIRPTMELAEVLTRQGRFREARDILEKQGTTPRASAALLEQLGDARLYDGDPAQALAAYRRAETTGKASPTLNRKLALNLAWTGQHQAALPRLQGIVTINPSDVEATLALARSLSATGRAKEAAELVAILLAARPGDLEVILTMADIEVGLGHASAARRLFETAETRDPSGRAAQVHAVRSIAWGDFHRAEKAARQQVASNTTDRAARLALAEVLSAAQRHEEAETILYNLARDAPRDIYVLATLAKSRLASKDAAHALSLAEQLIHQAPDAPDGPKLAIEAHRLAGEIRSAHEAARALCAAPDSDTLDCLATARTALLLGNDDAAQAAWREARSKSPGSPLAVYLDSGIPPADATPLALTDIANGLAEIGRTKEAGDILRQALAQDPECFPASMALAEILAATGWHQEALSILTALERELPGTFKIMLTKARVLSWARQYDEALAIYEEMARQAPGDTVALREAARTAYWAKNGQRGAENFDHLEAAVATVNPERAPSAALEGRVKALAHDRRFGRAFRASTDLLAIDPGNQEALFDRAQAACALGLCDEEEAAYRRLLAIDPLHSLAQKALFRVERRAAPAVETRFSFWDEDGKSGRLAQITRYRWDVEAKLPFAGRYVARLAQHLWLEDPKTPTEASNTQAGQEASAPRIPVRRFDGSYLAEGQSLSLSGRLTTWLSAEATFTNKQYLDPHLRPVYLGLISIEGNVWDLARLGLSYERQEELTNDMSLAQSIQSDNVVATLSTSFARRLDLRLQGQLKTYSDANKALMGRADLGLSLTDHPRELKLTLTGEARDTDETNRYVYVDDQLMTIVHPYWTPRNYRSGGVTLGWRHDLARDFYCGARRHAYGLAAGIGTDTDNNAFWRFEAEYRYDITDHITASAKGLIHRSREWDALGLWTAIGYRF